MNNKNTMLSLTLCLSTVRIGKIARTYFDTLGDAKIRCLIEGGYTLNTFVRWKKAIILIANPLLTLARKGQIPYCAPISMLGAQQQRKELWKMPSRD